MRGVLAVCVALLLAGCGGDNGSSAPAEAGGASLEEAYQEAYAAAWVRSCKEAVTDIRRRDSARRAGRVDCSRPVEQMEGNTSFDPEQARLEGRQQGAFDGCAYAWDEAYAASGEVEPRC